MGQEKMLPPGTVVAVEHLPIESFSDLGAYPAPPDCVLGVIKRGYVEPGPPKGFRYVVAVFSREHPRGAGGDGHHYTYRPAEVSAVKAESITSNVGHSPAFAAFLREELEALP